MLSLTMFTQPNNEQAVDSQCFNPRCQLHISSTHISHLPKAELDLLDLFCQEWGWVTAINDIGTELVRRKMVDPSSVPLEWPGDGSQIR
tara:strand:- start:3735 stop:4001 length:267 start_codon:yes stop_codon:yes gene_type:complete